MNYLLFIAKNITSIDVKEHKDTLLIALEYLKDFNLGEDPISLLKVNFRNNHFRKLP
jgi:hypothetical protein